MNAVCCLGLSASHKQQLAMFLVVQGRGVVLPAISVGHFRRVAETADVAMFNAAEYPNAADATLQSHPHIAAVNVPTRFSAILKYIRSQVWVLHAWGDEIDGLYDALIRRRVRSYLSPQATSVLLGGLSHCQLSRHLLVELGTLTPMERKVIRRLQQGMTYGEVATVLGVSLNTVRSHVRSAYGKG